MHTSSGGSSDGMPRRRALRRHPHHAYQHLYILPSLALMVVAWQYGDLCALFSKRTVASTLYGASQLGERG